MTREDAYGALFTLLQTVPVKTRGRRLELLEEMDAPQLPALFMTVGNQNIRDVEGAPLCRIYRSLDVEKAWTDPAFFSTFFSF